MKLLLAGVLFALAWAALWARTGWIQLYQGPQLERLATKQTLSTEFERGRRGRILARDGELLATSVEAKSVYIRPLEVQDRAATADALAALLLQPRKRMEELLGSRKNFVWVKRQVTDREAAAIDSADLEGVYLTSEFVRLYPQGRLAGQLLGFVNIDGKGLEGMERAFENRLAGGRAEQVKLRDASGRRLYLDAQGREVDIDGQDIRLTIDTHIQDVTEQALSDAVKEFEAKAGMAIVVKVKSGEILALANYPFFNPNAYRDSVASVRRNRAAIDALEPGSTMKPLLFAAALEEGVIEPNKLIDCENGRYRVGPHVIRDTHSYKWLPVNKVLRYSSNIGAAKIGEALGAQHYCNYLERLGFGSRTVLNLPAESKGTVRPVQEWNEFDLAAASFGQGIATTALQMVQGFLALANKGLLVPLKLLQEPIPEGFAPPQRVFREDTAEQVLSMMLEVVEQDGTGRRARIPGTVVGGKTGTAQKAHPDGGYGKTYLASFIGLVPGDNPDLLILVMIDEPKPVNYGSRVAAPVVREIAMRTLAYYGELPDPTAPDLAELDESQGSAVTQTATAVEAMEAAGTANASAKTDTTVAIADAGPGSKGETAPNVTGLPLRRAMEILARAGIIPVLKGEGMTVTGQEPAAGQRWPVKTEEGAQDVFILWLS
ncbi:MAG: penicillin-binding transpeptidase domain-containing protein [Desulfovibrionaceae bacterium]